MKEVLLEGGFFSETDHRYGNMAENDILKKTITLTRTFIRSNIDDH